MKPERIQFAPGLNTWAPTAPFIRKAFLCESVDDANHYAAHIHRVARPFAATSDVKTSVNDDFAVAVKIVPVRSEPLTEEQYALSERIDEALSYLEDGSFFDDSEDEN